MVATRRPGFDRDGLIALIPGLQVRVHDAFIAGKGLLHASLLGLLSLAEAHDTVEMADGGLMCFLAEAAWCPTAPLPPWRGRFWNCAGRDGMRVPIDGEVAWILPSGARPYWRGRITHQHPTSEVL